MWLCGTGTGSPAPQPHGLAVEPCSRAREWGTLSREEEGITPLAAPAQTGLGPFPLPCGHPPTRLRSLVLNLEVEVSTEPVIEEGLLHIAGGCQLQRGEGEQLAQKARQKAWSPSHEARPHLVSGAPPSHTVLPGILSLPVPPRDP